MASHVCGGLSQQLEGILGIFLHHLEKDEPALTTKGRRTRGARAAEGVHYNVVWFGVSVDERWKSSPRKRVDLPW